MLSHKEASESSADHFVRRFASCAYALDKDETLKLLKLMEAAKVRSGQIAVNLVGGLEHDEPVLVQYSAETTPVGSRKHLHA